jgi:hypothetical protein
MMVQLKNSMIFLLTFDTCVFNALCILNKQTETETETKNNNKSEQMHAHMNMMKIYFSHTFVSIIVQVLV